MSQAIEKPQETKRQKDRADRHARLLKAALELFETRGFDAVAVPEIAARAGMATGTVYLHFADKAALVNALYRHWKDAYNTAVLAPLPAELSVREKFSAYWQRMMQFSRDFPRAVRFMDLHHHAAYLDAASIAVSQTYRDAARAFVAEARDAGVIRDMDPILVVALMWGAAAGLVKFADQGALRFDKATAAGMEAALWRAIANP